MNELDAISQQLQDRPKKPPLHLWHPELSGDIDIEIKANGEWFHNGGLIKRKPLVKLFASILRKEQDECYYLVTPVEKWRIRVADAPIIIIAMDIRHAGENVQQIVFTSNVDDQYLLGKRYPINVVIDPQTGEPQPSLNIDNNLTAKINRAVYYQLADYAIEEEGSFILTSEGCRFVIG